MPHLHPIPVHFTQALFPAAFFSLLLYLLTGSGEFEASAHVMSLFALLTSPLTIATGFIDWKLRYGGQMTRTFRIKIIGAFLLVLLALPAVMLRLWHPEINTLPLVGSGWLYLGLLTACQPACIIVGYYGGKLVFH